MMVLVVVSTRVEMVGMEVAVGAVITVAVEGLREAAGRHICITCNRMGCLTLQLLMALVLVYILNSQSIVRLRVAAQIRMDAL